MGYGVVKNYVSVQSTHMKHNYTSSKWEMGCIFTLTLLWSRSLLLFNHMTAILFLLLRSCANKSFLPRLACNEKLMMGVCQRTLSAGTTSFPGAFQSGADASPRPCAVNANAVEQVSVFAPKFSISFHQGLVRHLSAPSPRIQILICFGFGRVW